MGPPITAWCMCRHLRWRTSQRRLAGATGRPCSTSTPPCTRAGSPGTHPHEIIPCSPTTATGASRPSGRQRLGSATASCSGALKMPWFSPLQIALPLVLYLYGFHSIERARQPFLRVAATTGAVMYVPAAPAWRRHLCSLLEHTSDNLISGKPVVDPDPASTQSVFDGTCPCPPFLLLGLSSRAVEDSNDRKVLGCSRRGRIGAVQLPQARTADLPSACTAPRSRTRQRRPEALGQACRRPAWQSLAQAE